MTFDPNSPNKPNSPNDRINPININPNLDGPRNAQSMSGGMIAALAVGALVVLGLLYYAMSDNRSTTASGPNTTTSAPTTTGTGGAMAPPVAPQSK